MLKRHTLPDELLVACTRIEGPGFTGSLETLGTRPMEDLPQTGGVAENEAFYAKNQ
jgi:hypothetical protein